MGSSVERTDENVREYLLYRGFTSTLRHLDSEIKVDKDKGFRVDKMVDQLLNLVATFDLAGLREYWSYLDRRLFSRLEDVYRNTVNKLRTSLYRYYVVNTIQRGCLDKTQEFFQKQGVEFHGQAEWRDWFALPFIPAPEQHPAFSPYFSRQWADTFLVSLHNFLSVLFQCMPQPALLSFDAEVQRTSSLTEENEQLRQLVFALQGSSSAGMKDQSENIGDQAPPHHKLPAYVQNMDRLGDTELDMVSNQKTSSVSTTPSRNFFSTFLPQGKRVTLPPAGGNKVGLSPNQSSVGRKEPAAATNQVKSKDGPSTKEVKPASNQAAPGDSQAPPTQTRQKRTQEHEKERKELFSKPLTNQVCERKAESSEVEATASASTTTTTAEAPGSDGAPDSSSSVAADEKEVGSLSVEQPFIKLSQEEYGEHHSSILHCRVDCSGRRVASLDVDGVVKVWSFNPVIQTKATIMSKSPLLSLEWATKPDRLLLLGSGQGTVRLYDTDAKKNLIEMNVDEAHPRILSLACSPSGSSFVCSAAAAESNLRRPALAEGKLLLWDTKTVKEQLQFSLEPRPVAVNCTAFNHNGNLLVTGAADGVIRLFDMQRYECAMSWHAHDGEVYTVEFSRDENTVFTVGEDGKFVQWNIHRCGVKQSEQELPQDASGPFVLSGYSGYKQVQVPRGRLFAFDSEGQHVLTCSNTGGVIYQLTNGEEPWLNNVLSLGGHRVSVVTVDWCCAVDCGACLTGSMDGKIRLSTLLAHKNY